jgi:hypothetical protein
MMVALAIPPPSHIVGNPCRPPLFQSIDQRGHGAGTASAEGLADRDGAAVHVGLGQVGPGVGSPGAGDRDVLCGGWLTVGIA